MLRIDKKLSRAIRTRRVKWKFPRGVPGAGRPNGAAAHVLQAAGCRRENRKKDAIAPCLSRKCMHESNKRYHGHCSSHVDTSRGARRADAGAILQETNQDFFHPVRRARGLFRCGRWWERAAFGG